MTYDLTYDWTTEGRGSLGLPHLTQFVNLTREHAKLQFTSNNFFYQKELSTGN